MQGVHAWQRLIQRSPVRLGSRCSSQRLLLICQSRDHGEIALGIEHRSKPVAEQAVVVDEEEAQLHDVLARYARATPDATFLAKLRSFGLDVHTNTTGEVARGAGRADDGTSARCARGRGGGGDRWARRQ